jgi:hypothetical protein
MGTDERREGHQHRSYSESGGAGMSTEKSLKVAEPQSMTVTPMDMLRIAIDKGTDLNQLEQLMRMQERYEAGIAKKEYVLAMTGFKANPPQVFKDMMNKQYSSKYASLGNFVNTVNPELSKYGLSANWEMLLVC